MKERRKRGFFMLLIGVLMMLTHFIGLDKAFLLGGVLFVVLGFGDLFFDNRYRRRY